MKFRDYSGTAVQYVREYLDPGNTLRDQPCANREEAEDLWEQLEEIFASDGGTGIRCRAFVEAAQEIGGIDDDRWESAETE